MTLIIFLSVILEQYLI